MKASMMMKSTNTEFQAILARRRGTPKGVMLSRILKSGKPGKPTFYQFFGCEHSAQDVINRMESNNPGDKWVEA